LTPAELAALRLCRTEGIGPALQAQLLRRHGDAAEALRHLPARFSPPPPREVEREALALERLGGRFLFLGAPGYPALLAEIHDPPPVLALLGDPAALAPRAVAIVGARQASGAGRQLAEEIAEGLAQAGLTVVSGLARGIDAAAHLGALRGGRTVAVVAGGLDRPYPRENAALQARIAAEGGAVLSEAPLGTAPLAQHFPKRNRIVAGLALGVLVVEAAVRSGTLITARLALEAGREVFAVPGHPKDPRSAGGNALIRDGAPLVENAQQVLDLLPDRPLSMPLLRERAERIAPVRPAAEASPPGDAAAQIIELLGHAPLAVDELERRCQLSGSALSAVLLELELAGRVETLPGNRVALA
jgi:DNA processing protein